MTGFMCGRFYIASEDETGEISRMIEEAARRQKAITGESTVLAGEIFPSAVAAALARGKNGAPGAYPMRWGFARSGEGKNGLIVNTRSETALQRPMFRASMLERRCLLPFSWYYEWETRAAPEPPEEEGAQLSFQLGPNTLEPGQKKTSGKNVRRVRYASRPARPGLMFLAGIYRYEKDRALPAFSVLTMPPAPEIAFIHDRMPVVLPPELTAQWLGDTAGPEETLGGAILEMSFRIA